MFGDTTLDCHSFVELTPCLSWFQEEFEDTKRDNLRHIYSIISNLF